MAERGNRHLWTEEFLRKKALEADDPADELITALVARGEIWDFITNMKNVANPEDDEVLPGIVQDFFDEHGKLPDWADMELIHEGEGFFSEYGPLTISALFCASLPECYVVEDEAAVLDRTGQLVDETIFRVRQTGRFVFSVMAEHGLDETDEHVHGEEWISGRVQTLIVRMIHAIVRHLIEQVPSLTGRRRAAPSAGMSQGEQSESVASAAGAPSASAAGATTEADKGGVPPDHRHLAWIEAFTGQATAAPSAEAFPDDAPGVAHGAASARSTPMPEPQPTSKPINQLQLAYTLLTFSYVIIRSLRRLGVIWNEAERRAYFHTWNVVGHILGVHEDLMAWNYHDAEFLFEKIKHLDDGMGKGETPAGAALSERLIEAMEDTLRWGFLRPIPGALTTHLVGPETSRLLGIDRRRKGIVGGVVYHLFLLGCRTLVPIAQLFGRTVPGVRFVLRVASRGWIVHLMETETLNLFAPTQLKQHGSRQLGVFERMVFKPTSPRGARA